MTKKNYTFLVFLIIIFGVINFFIFNKIFIIYSAEKNYNNNNFSGAIQDYQKSIDNNFLFGKKIEKNIYYNLGNSYFRFGQNSDEKIPNYELSLENYQKSIDISKEEKNQANYDFVSSELEKLKQQNQNEQEQEQNSENDTENSQENEQEEEEENENNENEDENNENETEQEEEQEQNSNQEQSSQNQNQDFEQQQIDSLTDEERTYLENYTEYIQNSQNDYNSYFNKQNQDSSRDLFDMFFEENFIENNDLGNKKDW